MVSGIVGSAVGFVLTGVLLSLWIDLGSPPPGLTDTDPAFIGAWWLGFAAAGAVALLAGVTGMRAWPRYAAVAPPYHSRPTNTIPCPDTVSRVLV